MRAPGAVFSNGVTVIELAVHCPFAPVMCGDRWGVSIEQIENKSLRQRHAEGYRRVPISDDGWIPNGFEI
jgi:hypothetical protein